MAKEITVFTDGSSLGNPGPGGWGSVVLFPSGRISELGGADKHTTNNRMEITAALEALIYIQTRPDDAEKADIVMHVDSAYVINGITKWVYGWAKNGWVTSTKEPVSNQDLWQALLEMVHRTKLVHDIIWKKVGGHIGVAGNERADGIATSFAEGNRVLLFSGSHADHQKLTGVDITNIVHDTGMADAKKRNKGKAYSYVSLVDGKVHVDKSWDACKARVSGKKGVKYKKVVSKEEEQALITTFTK